MTRMKTFASIVIGVCSVLLVAGCNGADSGTDGGGGDTGTNGKPANGGGEQAPADPTVDDIRKALGLTRDPVDIEDSMEAIDDLIYDEAWTAESENRVKDAVKPLLRAEHLFQVTVPEKEAHKSDAKFQQWMKQAAAFCAEGAEAAHRGDRAGLTAAFEKLDESCQACHKVYRKKKKKH
ncbi:MAG: cytochrome c [Planctomycetota bacterium]|jgi:hypothetical protein